MRKPFDAASCSAVVLAIWADFRGNRGNTCRLIFFSGVEYAVRFQISSLVWEIATLELLVTSGSELDRLAESLKISLEEEVDLNSRVYLPTLVNVHGTNRDQSEFFHRKLDWSLFPNTGTALPI